MKANELMIGDYVYNHRNWECLIVEIHENSAIVIARHYGEEDFLLSDLRPIPLTTEILEKYGFIKENGCWVLRDKHTGDKIISLFEVAKGFAMSTSGLTIGFQEVHKFQHLLKLCGIKKEIIL